MVAQTRDAGVIRAMYAATGVAGESIDLPARCFLLASAGDDPIGIVTIDTAVDIGLIRLLWVAEAMRRRGIGAALMAAARKAAHTRGARMLYGIDDGDFLRHHGFVPASREETDLAAKSFFATDRSQARLQGRFWILDLSRDGIIER